MKRHGISHGISALLIGGQGTYQDGEYYTEWPDRDSSVLHAANTRRVVTEGCYTHVICCGGFTQKGTPHLSEASSFLNMWDETQTRPVVQITLDEVSLDSTENVVFGLMALRKEVPEIPILRVAYYSLWQFKKARMVGCARDLGIDRRFYFHAYADHTVAWAHEKARIGEQAQHDKLAASQDFLLLGSEWEEKRKKRYCGPNYGTRTAELRDAFPKTFIALDSLRTTPARELTPLIEAHPNDDIPHVVKLLRDQKLGALQTAIKDEVMKS